MAHPPLNALAARQQAKKRRIGAIVASGHILAPIRNSETIPPHFAKKIEVGANLAWFKLCDGIGTFKEYNDVAWATNIVELGLKDQDIPEAMEVVKEASHALNEMCLHFEKTGVWIATDRAKAIVPSLLDLHGQLIYFLSTNQLENILTQIERERDRQS